ncbi:MAG: thioredoxin [Prolixibacteraceae bacterium]|nr:thioredoxin [Prolixibacteraceae bacterium]
MVFIFVAGIAGCTGSSKEKNNSAISSESKINNEIIYAETMSSFNEIIKSNQPVLVDFYADWCAPCRMMAPILEQVAGNMQGKVRVLKVNVDKNREAAMKYGIRSIPTLMLFHNGQVKWQGVGVIQADQIEQIVITKTS